MMSSSHTTTPITKRLPHRLKYQLGLLRLCNWLNLARGDGKVNNYNACAQSGGSNDIIHLV